MNAPRYLALALTPHERRMLWGGGDLSFREGARPAQEHSGRDRIRKPGAFYGRATRLARSFIAGKFPGLRPCDVARSHGVKEDSLRALIYSIRKGLRKEKGRAA